MAKPSSIGLAAVVQKGRRLVSGENVMRNFQLALGFTVGLATIGIGVAPARADDEEDYQAPALVKSLYACQSIAEDAERLNCFDRAVAAIRAAEEQRELSFADREQVREAKRGLFGLGNIRLGIFSRGEKGGDEDQLMEIDANVASISKGRDGKLLIRLEDGVLWAQTGTEKVRIRELKARTVKIKRAAFGSYTAQLDGGSTIKVKRVN